MNNNHFPDVRKMVKQEKQKTMEHKQLEKIQRLCLTCGDKYVRIDTVSYGVKNKMFFRCPRIVSTQHVKLFNIASDDAVVITSYKINRYKEHAVRWRNQMALTLDEGMRIYKTPFSTKAVKRIVNNMFNNKLK